MIEVTIEKMVYGGKGIARYNDLTLFISGALPSEKVQVEIKKKKGALLRLNL